MDKKLGGMLLVFFLLFSVFVTIVFFNKPLAKFTRAKEDYAPSAQSSLLFAYPLLVKADGTSKSAINVFIRSTKGVPVKDQRLTVSSTLGTLSATELTTDDQGKATAQLSSTEKGVASIEVLVDGTMKLTQKLSVKFE